MLYFKERQVIAKKLHITSEPPERAFLAAASLENRDRASPAWNAEDSIAELALLAETAGAQVVGRTVQRLKRRQPRTYVGAGKVEEIVSQRDALDYNLVIFDDELSPNQQRNLESALEVKVLDRTALILDIFAQHARSKEGSLQVELAQHQYLLPRLRGQWSHLERLEGRIGTRGPGETQLETDRRLLDRKIQRIKRELEHVRRQRGLYQRRRKRQGIPVVSLVGYTNSGKSTLMHAMSGAQVLIEDKLFATLDPLTRKVSLGEDATFLLTDTVGFIQKLPTQLIAAFRANLEELEQADLLLHIVDITHKNAVEQTETVERTLEDLGLREKPRLLVLNKLDLVVTREDLLLEGVGPAQRFAGAQTYAEDDVIMISAQKAWGIPALLRAIEAKLGAASVPAFARA